MMSPPTAPFSLPVARCFSQPFSIAQPRSGNPVFLKPRQPFEVLPSKSDRSCDEDCAASVAPATSITKTIHLVLIGWLLIGDSAVLEGCFGARGRPEGLRYRNASPV